MDIDRADLDRAARAALTQPSDSHMWDERYYDTHGVTFSWADRSDDLIEESNYHAALAAIRGAAVHTGNDPDDHVIDASVNHWAYGSLRQLFVRVYNDDGSYTSAFTEAASLALFVRYEHPVIDDSDLSEREYDRFQSNVRQAVNDAQRDYPDDTPEESAAFERATYNDEETSELLGREANGDVSRDAVAEIYKGHRNQHFEQRASAIAATYFAVTVCDGQLPLLP